MSEDTISRQAAIDAVRELYIQSPKINNDIVYDAAIDQAHDALVNLPSAQPEIIHCKECKHHHRDNSGAYYCGRKDYGYGWGLNDFCSDAERRTDE